MFDPKKFERNMVRVVVFADGQPFITLKTPQCLKLSDFVVARGKLFQFRTWKKNQLILQVVETAKL